MNRLDSKDELDSDLLMEYFSSSERLETVWLSREVRVISCIVIRLRSFFSIFNLSVYEMSYSSAASITFEYYSHIQHQFCLTCEAFGLLSTVSSLSVIIDKP